MKYRCAPLLSLLTALCLTTGNATASIDAIDMPLEALLEVSIVSTPKFAENPDRIPSVVSILTAEDIRLFGWRTLGDALRSLQGLNVTDDHTYAYAGIRGVSPPGDYRPRMQMLIDGMSVNENIYASVPVDSAFPLDIALIERIEVIRGPSASVYGGDAMFGVINIVTRSGHSLGGVESSLSLGSGAQRRLRASWGGKLAGNDTLISLTGFDADGRSLAFDDVNGDGSRRTLHGIDGESGGQFFFKTRGEDWNLSLVHARRQRIVTTASYDTIADDRGHVETDRYTLIDLGKDWKLNATNTLHQRLYFGDYGYDGEFPYDYSTGSIPDPRVINIDRVRGSWWGIENRLVNTAFDGQRWTLAVEYRANIRQNQMNYDRGYGCYDYAATPCLDDRQHSHQITLMAQDEIQLGNATHLTVGLRYDNLGHLGSFWSPRLGITHDAGRAGLFKVLYGTAFRSPTVYERAYITPSWSYGNPNVDPEKLQSLELAWEKRLGPMARLTATVYHLHVDRMITVDDAGLAINGSTSKGNGLEVEYEQRWHNGARLRGGFSIQYAGDEKQRFDNSPRQMAKLNLVLPTGLPQLTAALEGQWISSRLANQGANRVGAYALANVNLRYAPVGQSWEASLGVHNLFDQRHDDPVAMDEVMGVSRWRMPQIGRSVLLQGTLRF